MEPESTPYRAAITEESMDRLRRYLPPKVAAPLATLAVAGLLGAVLRLAPVAPPAKVSPPSPRASSVQAVLAAPKTLWAIPADAPEAALARKVPVGEPPGLLRPVEFPDEEAVPAGPVLVSPSREASSPVEPPATLVPPPNAKPALPEPQPSAARQDDGESIPPRGVEPPRLLLGEAPGAGDGAAAHSTPLWTPFRPEDRSGPLEEIAREADRHTRRGFELASRGAVHSARAEFIQALRLVAQGLDAEHASRVHSLALGAGLVAIEEAEDFLPSGSRLEADLDLAGTIAGHRTAVLKGVAVEGLSSMEALRRYLGHAQDQLAVAAGGEVAGSMALHALGKLHAARRGSLVAAEAKAVTFYQAALLACPGNSLAANDLGVLLAQSGRLAEARVVFEHGLSIQDHPTTRQNLILVASRMDLRESPGKLAASPAIAALPTSAQGRGAARPAQAVRWVDPNEFARSYTETPDAHEAPPAQRATASAGEPAGASPESQPAAGPWLWNALSPRKK